MKQSHKHQIRPSPFHPTPERTFAHGFTPKVATLRRSQLLHDLDGGCPPRHGQRSRTPDFRRAFHQKSHRLAPQMPASHSLAAKEVARGHGIHPLRLRASRSHSAARNLGLGWDVTLWENNHHF